MSCYVYVYAKNKKDGTTIDLFNRSCSNELIREYLENQFEYNKDTIITGGKVFDTTDIKDNIEKCYQNLLFANGKDKQMIFETLNELMRLKIECDTINDIVYDYNTFKSYRSENNKEPYDIIVSVG